MESVNLNSTSPLNLLPTNKLNTQEVSSSQDTSKAQPVPVESTKVTISEQGRALLEASPEVNEQQETQDPDKTNSVESFAYGALGLDHPDQVPAEEKDSSYTAGQYLKGALTIGSILLAVV